MHIRHLALLAVLTTILTTTLSVVGSGNRVVAQSTAAPSPTGAMMDKKTGWLNISLKDVNTGKTFKLSDFAGKTVLIEPMATWCSNCRKQLSNVSEARTQLKDENFVFIALSVEQNLPDKDLAAYTKAQGFDWTFAVAPPDMIRALTEQFGRSAVNPPGTPHIFISPEGKISELMTGFSDPATLVADLKKLSGK